MRLTYLRYDIVTLLLLFPPLRQLEKPNSLAQLAGGRYFVYRHLGMNGDPTDPHEREHTLGCVSANKLPSRSGFLWELSVLFSPPGRKATCNHLWIT